MTFLGTIRHLFVPHYTNNHRSKVLHTDALLFYVLVFAVFNLGFRLLHREMPDVLGYATDIHVEQLLAGTNSQRQAAGLGALTLNAALSQAAANKARDMFEKGYWAHNSPTGATPWNFITDAGYRYSVAGENLAKNFSTSQGVIDAWMASPTHRDNILKSSYREIGFAVVNGVLQGEETTLVVQMFGAPSGSVAVAQAPSKPATIPKQAFATEEKPKDAAKPVEVNAPIAESPQVSFNSMFLGVTKKPAISIPTLTRDIVFIFAGVLLGVLLLDAWVVSRKKIVRVAGHNIAHFLFLSSIMILIGSVGRGALL